MAIKKLGMHTGKLAHDLIRKLQQVIPEAVTESRTDNDEVEYYVDYDLLRTALEGRITEGHTERYQLTWPGKREALVKSNEPIYKTLRPVYSKSINFHETKNLFIEGDNLDALKLIREAYVGRINIIYIDPPYNTGSDLIYMDDYSVGTTDYLERSGQIDTTKEKLVTNPQSAGRFHSDWLSMMYPRLRIARQLLAEDGIIFISIDDNERANLQKLCEEIFGGENFLGCFVWKRRSGAMDAITNLSEDHEYVLVYTKSSGVLRGVERTFEKYTNPDNDPRGPWIADNLTAGKPGGDTYYPIKDPKTGREYWPPKGRYWPYSRETMAKKIAEGRVIFPRDEKGTPMLKRFASEAVKPTIPVSSWIERSSENAGQNTLISPMNNAATKALKSLFDDKVFSFPKPVELIKALIKQGGSNEALVLDFFAGSATTAQAVIECNAEDGGKRTFILVQLPETIEAGSSFATICDLAQERIRRSAEAILRKTFHPDWNRDVGFRVLKVDSSNMKDTYYRPDELEQGDLLDLIDNIKPDRTPEDLLFQVMLDWGVDLTLPIRRETIQGKAVFFVNEPPYDLIACFDTGINEELIKELARYEPLRVVFRDSGFATDAVKINAEQIFRQLSPNTEVKSL
jgi:Adenine specific DNA methylase Mod